MSEPSPENPLEAARKRVGATWPHIEQARQTAEATLARLEEILADITLPPDTGLLAFGSIARQEFTAGSDIDWTLLVDGPADPGHAAVTQQIKQLIEDSGMNPPGRTGVFGGLACSHDIVHQIGGDADTNRNITRRILLLLESTSLGRSSSGQPDDVRDRIIRILFGCRGRSSLPPRRGDPSVV